MIQISDGVIYIAQGDCGIIDFDITAGGESYTMQDEDYLELVVRETPTADSPVLLSVQSEKGVAQIVLHTDQTSIDAGRYSATVKLHSDGCVYTVFPPIDTESGYKTANKKNFVVVAEVTKDD